jgi:hypothetical protein
MEYKTTQGAKRGARLLLNKLQSIINKNPNKFCENYGQNEISDFEDRLINLHYVDKCNVMELLFRVSSMTPQIS